MTRNERVSRRAHRTKTVGGGAAVLAVAALALTGCGAKDDGAAATPKKVPGQASPLAGDKSGAGTDADASKPAGDDASEDTGAQPGDSDAPSAGSSKGAGDTSAPDGEDSAPPAEAKTACHTSELKATVGEGHPGAGQENFPLVLTNGSGHTCTVYGFPGLAFVDGGGHQVSVDPERTSAPKARISLAPGESAWAPLSFTNPQMTDAKTVTPASVKITPPDELDPLTIPWSGGSVTDTPGTSVPRVGPFSKGTGA